MRKSRRVFGSIAVLVATLLVLGFAPRSAEAASAKAIDAAVDEALKSLYASTPAAVELEKVAKGIFVFPQVVKGGFILGAEFGNGAAVANGGDLARSVLLGDGDHRTSELVAERANPFFRLYGVSWKRAA